MFWLEALKKGVSPNTNVTPVHSYKSTSAISAASNNPVSLTIHTGKDTGIIPELLSCCWCLRPSFQHPGMLSVTAVPWSEQTCMTVYCLFDPQTAALEYECVSA